ncbi:MAG: hypothetical protein AB2693_09725 [Candidatus Thiodiazotropha sp.]
MVHRPIRERFRLRATVESHSRIPAGSGSRAGLEPPHPEAEAGFGSE